MKKPITEKFVRQAIRDWLFRYLVQDTYPSTLILTLVNQKILG